MDRDSGHRGHRFHPHPRVVLWGLAILLAALALGVWLLDRPAAGQIERAVLHWIQAENGP